MSEERIFKTEKKLRPYINYACNQFSQGFTHLETNDLKQEVMIKLIELSEQLKQLDQEEFEAIFKKSVYNLLRNIYREERRKESTIPSYNGTTWSDNNELYIEEISLRLTPTQAKIFELILNPDEELIEIVMKYFIKKNKEKDQGKLVMNANQIRLKAIHLAERLNLSSAIISKHLSRIREVTLDVML